MIRAILVMTATIVLCTLAVGCSESSDDTAGRDRGPKPVPAQPMDPPSASVKLGNRGSSSTGSDAPAANPPAAGGSSGGGK